MDRVHPSRELQPGRIAYGVGRLDRKARFEFPTPAPRHEVT